MCPGVAGDAEPRGAAATGRRSVDGSLRQGHGPAGSGRVSTALCRRFASFVTLVCPISDGEPAVTVHEKGVGH